MFNKEKSNKNTSCRIISKLNYKKIGTFMLTMTLINSLSGNVKADNAQEYHDYSQRVLKYSEEKEYDEKYSKLYYVGRFIINGNEIKSDRVFIVAGQLDNKLTMYLYCAKMGKIDFLSGNKVELDNPILIPLRETTLFKTLIDDNLILIDDKKMYFDMSRIDEIYHAINNWDGNEIALRGYILCHLMENNSPIEYVQKP